MGFDKIIAQAARRGRVVRLKLKGKGRKQAGLTELVDLEPYSVKEKGGSLTFFCLHPESRAYLNIELTSILEAEVTERCFKPRFPVAF